ncbi:MAG: response regulator transcription factor [Bacteroidia bacterium]|nr:response regulator transcription factor [Bacteroidia bacterium]
MPVRVALFEDNKKYRESMSLLIEGSPGFALAGAFDNARDVLSKIEQSQPDVLLMDIEMPGISGIEALLVIKKKYPQLNVLIDTVFEDDKKIFEAICNGASGYVLKSTPPARLLDAIVETYQGGAPMSPVIAKKVLQLLQDKQLQTPQPTQLFDLTQREKEILALMVNGFSYKMIAAEKGITFETVRSHIKNIYQKLHVVSMAEAVAKAVKNNLA